jgi:EmrB/QacA subfamily drug resistance transporter
MPDAAPLSQTRDRAPAGPLIPIIIGSALFMQTLDATVIANALPAMAQALGESPLRLNLAISVYMLSTAIFLPLSAWLADRFGARTIFALAIGLFAVSSVFCGLSRTLTELIMARVAQGFAGAMMAPVGRLVLLKTLPKSELVGALAILTMPALLGPVVGPMLGGFIVTFGSWRWIFFINVPIGVLGVVLVSMFVPNVREAVVARLDWRGFALSGIGLAGTVYGFENLGRGALPPIVLVALFAGGTLCLWLYARHARSVPAPILKTSFFRIQTYSASVIGGGFSRLVIGASPFLLAMLLQVAFGLSAFAAGLMTFVSAAGALFMKTVAPPLIRRYGFRRILVSNTYITAAALACYALFRPGTPHAVILLVLFVGGFFRSLQFTCLGSMAYADIPNSLMSQASSLSSVGQQLAQAVGVGLAALILHLTVEWRGSTTLDAYDIAPAFLIVAALSLCALFFYTRLPVNAAAELRG